VGRGRFRDLDESKGETNYAGGKWRIISGCVAARGKVEYHQRGLCRNSRRYRRRQHVYTKHLRERNEYNDDWRCMHVNRIGREACGVVCETSRSSPVTLQAK